MEYAFQYVKDNRGLDARASYAYEAWNGPCRYDPKYSAADVTGYVKIPVSEAALMNAVATVGPVSVGIDSHHYSFRFYSGGMYYEADCNGSEIWIMLSWWLAMVKNQMARNTGWSRTAGAQVGA
ncbi:Procathepsin L [Lemmus lemmus]